MAEIKWEFFDEHNFVLLVARLLQRMGFIDVQIQGKGPDGGLDIFATEMVAFAFQGARPVRWGIQCKFSKDGTGKSVTDKEVWDVLGIIRSERYVSQSIQGYMLITNRRVAQNVVDRLRGVDRQTEFHATYIDGDQLSQHLAEQPKLLDEYFSKRLEEIEELARQQAKEIAEEQLLENKGEIEPLITSGIRISEWSGPDLSGTFESYEGIMELYHDVATDSVEGRYQYMTEDFVAEFSGEIHGSIIKYKFYWPEKGYSGVGFWFISPDGNNLEGLWFQGVDLENLTFYEMVSLGNRRSHVRIE